MLEQQRKIVVGINAEILKTPGTNGIKRYVIQMVKHLSHYDLELVLFSPRPLDLTAIGLVHTNISQINPLKHSKHPLLEKLYWQFLQLPRLLSKTKLTIFWGPNHSLPWLNTRRIPCILTIHDLVWIEHRKTMRLINYLANRLNVPSAVRRASLVLADSQATAAQLSQAFPKCATKIMTVHAASHTDPLQNAAYSAPSLADDETNHIMMLGTFEPRKNHQRLIAAYARLSTDLKTKHRLIIAGNRGWGKVNLEETVRKHGVEQYVSILYSATDAEIKRYLTHARLLAMPSLYEGFGLPIVEANSVGVPVLTSNNSSMVEVGGKAAVFVDPYSVDDIYSVLEKILTDDKLWHSKQEHAFDNAKRFSWEESAKKLHSAFQSLIKQGS